LNKPLTYGSCFYVFIACTEQIEAEARREYEEKRKQMLNPNIVPAPTHKYVNATLPAEHPPRNALYEFILDQPQYSTVISCLDDQDLLSKGENKGREGYAAVGELFGAISEEIQTCMPPTTVTGTAPVIYISLTVLNRRRAYAVRCLLEAAAYEVVISDWDAGFAPLLHTIDED
jgi:hypothetical protein